MKLALALACLLACAAYGAEIALPPPGSDAWRPFEFPKIPRHTVYTAIDAGGVPGVRATSECGASARLYPLDGIDLAATPRLRWRWRIEQGLALADERTRAGDDFAARVYVTFRFAPERASWYERARRKVAEALWGEQLPGSALNYVWSSRQPAGADWPNPFAESNRMLSRGAGPSSEWRDEEVDLRADYARAFGAPAPRPLFVAIMTDADNSCGRAVASYADFRLLPPR